MKSVGKEVNQQTNRNWIKRSETLIFDDGNQDRCPRFLTTREKYQMVVDAAGNEDEQMGEYLRERGLHSEHITIWDQELRDMIDKKHEQQDKEKALAEAVALLIKKKARGTYLGRRGRLNLEDHKAEVMMLIEEAHANGSRYSKACEVVGISNRTLQRWKQGCLKDRRKGSSKTVTRKVPQETREQIISCCNEPRFHDLTPYEIVPQLIKVDCYLAFASTVYRILREADQLHHRNELCVGHRHMPCRRNARPQEQIMCTLRT